MMKAAKIVALLAQLVLSFHGEGHPPHDEHKSNDRKVIHATAR